MVVIRGKKVIFLRLMTLNIAVEEPLKIVILKFQSSLFMDEVLSSRLYGSQVTVMYICSLEVQKDIFIDQIHLILVKRGVASIQLHCQTIIVASMLCN